METNTKYLDNLTADAARLAEIQTDIADDVTAARQTGASWAEIGRALGITKQAAQQKYGKIISSTPATPAAEFWTQADVSTPPAVTPSIFVEPEAPADRIEREARAITELGASDITFKFWKEAAVAGLDVKVQFDAEANRLSVVIQDHRPAGGWTMINQYTKTSATRRSFQHFYSIAHTTTSTGKKASRNAAWNTIQDYAA